MSVAGWDGEWVSSGRLIRCMSQEKWLLSERTGMVLLC